MLYNRDLSWLGFNFRVLQEAADKRVPLFERLKFFAIFSSNLDEFFRVRYPSIVAFSKLSRKTRIQATTQYEENLPDKVQAEINRQLLVYSSVLTQSILPELNNEGIHLYYNEELRPEHIAETKDIFLSQVLTFIQPLFLDADLSKHFLPENNYLYFIITLRAPGDQTLRHAVVNIPSEKLQRFVNLSPIDGTQYVVFIDDIIRENVSCLFPGFEIIGIYSIKFNRDAELHFDEEYDPDLLGKIEKQLQKRQYGPPSRFLYEAGMPRNVQLFLGSAFDIRHEEMFEGGRYHNLSDFAKFPTFDKTLFYPQLKPLSYPGELNCGDIFDILNQRDVLLHLPYDSYNTVLSFFNQAAVDANVTDIYITIYRVAADSHIVNALISAAKNGKNVTVFVELKARFDEANNIKWSRRMKDAGVQIVYSPPEIKVHSKIGLIKRNIGEQTVCYCILSTGNFHEVTAKFYTDHVLLTTDPVITEELLQLYKLLSKRRRDKVQFDTLLVSQFNMKDKFERLISQEIQKVHMGHEGLIRIKINNLEEASMIHMLYKASNAGVQVQLLVRSVCCLVPGIEGLSENITVKRIVDRYLEHSRIFIFGTDDDCEVIMGSADWMNRNLHRRIEVCVPVKDKNCRQELLDYFKLQWQDTDKAVTLTSTMDNQRTEDLPDGFNAQLSIYSYLKNRV
ncbi:MAG TPA: polyphosphate kinase 1 [Chitinophagaceae bacterium]